MDNEWKRLAQPGIQAEKFESARILLGDSVTSRVKALAFMFTRQLERDSIEFKLCEAQTSLRWTHSYL